MAKEIVAKATAQVPDYIKQGTNRGSEGVGMDDLTIPRLELVQALSPCRKKNDPAYIEGAEEGMLYNNVSREIYGTSVVIVPVIFKKEYLIWKDRKLGGGFRGAYSYLEEAQAMIQELVNADPQNNQGLDAVDTGQHLCLLVRPDGRIEEIAISMSRSKMKVSRQLNSLVRMTGGDRFSRSYLVEGVPDKNDKNEDFFNFRVSQYGFPSQEAYQQAEELYEAIKSGEREVKINNEQEGESAPENGNSNGVNF
jgi:hypothetical protein